MMKGRITSMLLAGLLAMSSASTFAASGDGATGTSTMPPDNTPGSPAGGTSSDTHGSSGTGTDGGASGSGSGAGGGTGSAGGGTGGAGGGTGSSTHKSNP
ncbi:hypothetical protein LLY42_25740 [Pseudomonas frederiksbergensis]|nr:hypothetical protein LLY42_25740 [Pseudomonas frederiksbergensis]